MGALVAAFIYVILPENLKAEIPVFHRAPELIDVEIVNVDLQKIAMASQGKNYSQYVANVAVRNNGQSLSDASLTLSSGGNRADANVQEQKQQFYFGYNDTVILQGYNVLVDSKYNGELITFSVSLDNYEDAKKDNNVFTQGVVDFENTGLADVSPTGVNGGRISLNLPVNLGEDFDYYLLHSNMVDAFPNKTFSYHELVSGENVLSYFVGRSEISDMEIVKTFDEIGIDVLNPVVSFSSDVYRDMSPHIFAIKAVKKDKTVYSFSNFVVLPIQSFVNKAEFAKLVTENLQIPLDDSGNAYFVDLKEETWFLPYVKTLLNKGFIKLDKNFGPAEPISRGEVCRVITEALDLPFKVSLGAPHFQDVQKDSPYYYTAETLFSHGYLDGFSLLMPNAPANRAFLQSLLKQK